MTINFKKNFAKLLRAISVPPIVVTSLVSILANFRRDIFHKIWDFIVPITCLGIVPILAYPFQKILPKYRKFGREAKRELAFLFSSVGYTFAFVWSTICTTSKQILLLCSTYFLSLVLLIICNKALKLRASGHSCSISGPLILLIYFLDWNIILPCIVYLALVCWASLYLKRHTAKELTFGSAIAFSSFTISFFSLSFFIDKFKIYKFY